MIELQFCPGSLAEGFDTYSPSVLRRMFGGRKVSPLLPFSDPRNDEQTARAFRDNRKRISISGVQEKLSLLLEKNHLRLTREGESGTYILKPVPYDVAMADQVPANEHLTMQIAQQVYGIPTAENVLVFFSSGQPAYLTRRFDYDEKGGKTGQEDFASLANRSTATHGQNFKYEGSYEEMARLIDHYVAAVLPVKESFFRLVVFNYLFSNGDAHLKNFSLRQTTQGDYLLSPAYDLLNTRLHVNDSDLAMEEGLFADDFETESFLANGFYTGEDFIALGKRIGLLSKRVEKMLLFFATEQEQVFSLIAHSYLSEEAKALYRDQYQDRLGRLQYGLVHRV